MNPVFVILFKGKIILYKEGNERNLEGKVCEVEEETRAPETSEEVGKGFGGDREDKQEEGREINMFF